MDKLVSPWMIQLVRNLVCLAIVSNVKRTISSTPLPIVAFQSNNRKSLRIVNTTTQIWLAEFASLGSSFRTTSVSRLSLQLPTVLFKQSLLNALNVCPIFIYLRISKLAQRFPTKKTVSPTLTLSVSNVRVDTCMTKMFIRDRCCKNWKMKINKLCWIWSLLNTKANIYLILQF